MKKIIGLLLVILLVSCKSTSDKIDSFVDAYNKSVAIELAKRPDSELSNTSAKKVSDSLVELTLNFKESMAEMENDTAIYTKLYPPLIAGAMKQERSFTDLINNKVSFKLILMTSDNKEFSNTLINKSNFDKLTSGIGDNVSFEDGSSEGLKAIIDLLNKSLPIENKQEGYTILKIDIEGEDTLLYRIQMDKKTDLSALKNNPAAKSLVKEEILRDPSIKNMFLSTTEYGINKMKIQYLDHTGAVLVEVLVSKTDF